MGGKRIMDRMMLKPYIQKELQRCEFVTPQTDYIRGKIDAFKQVLNRE